MNRKLLARIHQVAELLPPSLLRQLVERLVAAADFYTDSLKYQLLSQIPNPKFRRSLSDLLATWQADGDGWDSRAIAAALDSAAHSIAARQEALSVELVWTGPETEGVALRRTDGVLLELIEKSQQELIIVSFAVYKIPTIARALEDAIARGVSLILIVETPASGDGKIPFGIDTALGKEITSRSRVFVWPKEKRPVDDRGNYGSLHVKCAIRDRYHLMLTSANLTQYALNLNMEMGLLVRSRDLATQISRHLETLIEREVLVPISSSN